MKKIVLLFVLLFSLTGAFAQSERTAAPQENQAPPQIMHVNQYIAGLRNSTRSATNAPLRIESLINDLQSSIYLENGTANTYGDTPVCLFTDVASLSNIANLHIRTNRIEIVTIKVNNTRDLANAIDLSVFSNFGKLKYIYILSTVNASESDIVRMVRNNTSNYNVIYNIVKRG